MDENKFWAFVLSLIATVAVAAITAGSICAIDTDERLTEMVTAGANPIEVKCALGTCNERLCEMYQLRMVGAGK